MLIKQIVLFSLFGPRPNKFYSQTLNFPRRTKMINQVESSHSENTFYHISQSYGWMNIICPVCIVQFIPSVLDIVRPIISETRFILKLFSPQIRSCCVWIDVSYLWIWNRKNFKRLNPRAKLLFNVIWHKRLFLILFCYSAYKQPNWHLV